MKMNEIKIDWEGHTKKYQAAMEDLNLDFCLLTRVKSITYLSGCFVPWKSYIFLPKEELGEPELFTVLLVDYTLQVYNCKGECIITLSSDEPIICLNVWNNHESVQLVGSYVEI